MDKKSMLADLRLGAGLTKRAEELNEMAEANKQDDNVGMPEIYSAEMQCFKFESVIRPSDNALVIHLKHLPPVVLGFEALKKRRKSQKWWHNFWHNFTIHVHMTSLVNPVWGGGSPRSPTYPLGGAKAQ